jgi:hypothetical protein
VRKAAFAGLVMIAVSAAGARAQEPAAPQPSAPRPAPPENRRHSIKMMEAVLSRAVLGGAEHLAEQLGNGSPNVSFFTGQARAHGFQLDTVCSSTSRSPRCSRVS